MQVSYFAARRLRDYLRNQHRREFTPAMLRKALNLHPDEWKEMSAALHRLVVLGTVTWRLDRETNSHPERRYKQILTQPALPKNIGRFEAWERLERAMRGCRYEKREELDEQSQ